MAAAQGGVRIREAGPEDVDAVTDVMIISMQEDYDWWDYRFPHRHQHPGDHRRFLRLLVEAWISPEFANWVVTVAEVYVPSAGSYRVGSYSAWELSCLDLDKRCSPSRPQTREVLARAGAASRRDANPAHAEAHSRACDVGHERFLDCRFGRKQTHLQALGTHPLFLRRGLARALCRWGMDRAARDGVVVTLLASPMGRQVYLRFGFEELGGVTAQVDGEDEKTHLYAMVWEPGPGE